MNSAILWRNCIRLPRPCISAQVNRRFVQSDQRPSASMTFGDYMQGKLFQDITTPFYLRFFKKSHRFLPMDKNLQKLLDTAGAQLYYDCANSYPYLALLKEFDLPDYMASWYKLTLIHIWFVLESFYKSSWLCLMRLQLAFDAAAYQRIQHSILASLWFDVEARLKAISEELGEKFDSKNDLKKMHGVYFQSLFEYDEGFLESDCMLAAAVWRNLYMRRSIEPEHLNKVVKYMRASVAYLNTLDADSLVVTGIKKWGPAEQLANQL
ncbi:Ubiquinol-cytochrome C chaperone domain containing protein [Aphelenchoides bicaudatus]|nr:Ubiquinol-cytochrome C chaperone domain containing protein [Aphelenchoides bicaudatus]